MAKIQLYSSEVCPFAQRTRLALLEKGLEFDLTEIAYAGDHFDKPKWFLDIAPTGKVPVLVRDGDVVYESDVINEYLEEVYPEPPLLPREPGRRAMARVWMNFANGRFIDAFYHLMIALTEEQTKRYAADLAEALRTMEGEGLGRLADGGPFWMGKKVTLPDLSFYPFFERFGMLAHYRGFRMPEGCTRLRAWLAAMEERPSVRATRNSTEFHVEAVRAHVEGRAKGDTYKEMRKTLAAAKG